MPSVSLRSGVVKTSSVGTLTMCGMPSTVSSAPVSQRWPSREADAQVGPRADEPERGERALVEGRGALPEPRDVLAPRRDRVGLVEARRGGDRVPEPLDVGLAEHGACPALVRVADDRPLDEAPVLGVEELLDREPRPCALRAALVEVGEQLGLGVAGDRDRRAARLDHVVDERDRPRRAPVERVVGSVLDARALQVLVAVEHLDVARAALVRDPADGPDEGQDAPGRPRPGGTARAGG